MRPSQDEMLIHIAMCVGSRSTCLRRSVGCVIINKRGHILATGYNGVGAGMPHCNEGHPCKGYDLPPGQDSCEAVHAEINALLQCANAWEIDTLYSTLSPCIRCTKILLNTSCTKIMYADEHEGETGKELWIRAGRVWAKL